MVKYRGKNVVQYYKQEMHTESQWENTREGHIISRSVVKLSPLILQPGVAESLLQEPVMAMGQDWVPCKCGLNTIPFLHDRFIWSTGGTAGSRKLRYLKKLPLFQLLNPY